MTPSCTTEMRRFSRDRFGSRLLLMTIDQLSTSSLRQFLHQVTGDPVIGQVVIAQHAGVYNVYNVCMMRRSARWAANNEAVYDDEREAVFAAAFVARLGDIAAALADNGGGASTPAPEVYRRWRYLVGVAMRHLQSEDGPNGSLIRLALGCPMPDDGSAEDSARLQTVVTLAWTELCARFPGYHLPRTPFDGLGDGADPALKGPS